MADTRYIRPYAAIEQHQADMRKAIRHRRYRVAVAVLAGAALTLVSYWLSPPLAALAGGIGLLMVFFSAMTGGSSVAPSALAGAEGEIRVLQVLQQLPDDYVLFNQIGVPDPTVAGGRRELDFIVIGPGGIYCIEVKNTPGLIYVRPQMREWPLVRKAGCGGRPGWNAIVNPVAQVTAQMRAIDQWLLQHGHAETVRPVVCFAHPAVALRDRDSADMPVLTAAELSGFFSRVRDLPARDPTALIRLLAAAVGQPCARKS